MNHKEACYEWVEAHKIEVDARDGWWNGDGWYELDDDGKPTDGPYATEGELNDVLWAKTCDLSWASLQFGAAI